MNIIISGASRGIGKAIAGVFAGEGHRIFICSRGELPLYKAMEDLTTRFPSADIKAMPADLGRREEAEKFADWCLQSGAPDILVNNAGTFEPGEVHTQADGVLENQIAVNLYSAYYLTRRLLPAMMEKKSGHIFNICSIASLDAYRNGGAYSISKFALYGFHKNLRKEMMPYGIKVTALFPGAVMTDSWSGFDNSANRIMNPEDIAGLVQACSRLSPAACVEEIVIRPLQGDL